MTEIFTLLSEHIELTLFLLVGLGAILGHFSVKGISLGAAAVLFIAIAVSAWAASDGVTIDIPPLVGHIGLALFTFTVGISSGPSFFHTMKTSGVAVLGVTLAITAGAGVAWGLAPLFGLTAEQAAGTFAGALTNTPSLAAAGNSPEATVGYSVSYIFGVVGTLLVINRGLRHRAEDADTPAPLIQRDVRIERVAPTTVGEFERGHDNAISVTRVRHTEEGPVALGLDAEPLRVDDVVTVVGPEPVVQDVVRELGHLSSHRLSFDRASLDFRRVTVSDPKLAGKAIGELDIEDTYGATISRVRRADADMMAHPRLVLQLGDRVRVVAPRAEMEKVTAYFGDSSRGLTIINPAALGLGMALGFALGAVPAPLPGGGSFTLGPALGCLLVGLLMGRIGRIGPAVLSLPFTVTAVMSEFGLLLFLAQAGTRAGTMILSAFASGQWLGIAGLGACITLAAGLIGYAWQRRFLRMGGTTLAGLIAGQQTQPALLAYANNRTDYDFRVTLGYTMAYPTAMILKILAASVLRMIA